MGTKLVICDTKLELGKDELGKDTPLSFSTRVIYLVCLNW